MSERERVREKGVGEKWGKLGGLGWGEGGRMDMGSGKYIYTSTKGIILGSTRDLIIKGIPGPRRDPQMVLWTEERVPEPALAHNDTDEYFACHHRILIWRWMEMEAENHVGTLDLAP